MPPAAAPPRGRRAWGPLSVVRIASENAPASAPSAARRARTPATSGSRGSSRRSRRSRPRRPRPAPRPAPRRRRACCAARGGEAALAVGHVGVAGVGRPPRAARRGRPRATRPPARPRSALVVKRAAETVVGASRHEHAHVEPLRLDARRHARGAEARRQRASARARSRAPGARPSASGRSSRHEPLGLGQAEHQVQVLHRLAGRALPEVVDGAEREHAPGRRLTVAWMRRGSCRARRATPRRRVRPPPRTARRA